MNRAPASALFALLVGCAGAPVDPKPMSIPPVRASEGDAGAAPRAEKPADVAELVAAAWTSAIARPGVEGTELKRALFAIRAGAQDAGAVRSLDIRHHAVNGGKEIVLVSPRLLVLVDAATSAPRRVAPNPEPSIDSITAAAEGPLFLVSAGKAKTLLFDTRTLAPLTDFGAARATIATDGSAIALLEKTTASLWDVATRKRVWSTEIDVPTYLQDAVFMDGGRVVLVRDIASDAADVLERATGKRIVSFAYGISPAFSSDGKRVAYVAPSNGKGPKILRLADRASGTTIAESSACSGLSSLAFDATGARLITGSAQGVCMFDVPSLKLTRKIDVSEPREAKTPATQGVQSVAFVAGDRMIYARRADQIALLFDSTSKRVWQGAGWLVRFEGKTMVFGGQYSALAEIGSDGRVQERMPTSEEASGIYELEPELPMPRSLGQRGSYAVLQKFCQLDGWLLPTASCE